MQNRWVLGLVVVCLMSGCAHASAAPPPPAAHAAASPVPAPLASKPTNLEELAAENPNIRQQFDAWRELRARAGQDPTDYAAFRRHLLALGAPDPGEAELSDFSVAAAGETLSAR
jgi:hypothetical protein